VKKMPCLIVLAIAGCGLNQNDPFHERPVVSRDEAPPPIAGGTLAITRDGRFALVADPDLDRLLRVDLTSHEVHPVALADGDEPGRIAEDATGRAYVALRHGGGLAVIDVNAGRLERRIEVCAAPRGVAWEPEGDQLHVACADGALVTLDPDRVEARRQQLPAGLQDVVVSDGAVLVTRLRSAEVLRVGEEGVVIVEALPDAVQSGIDEEGDPTELHQTYAPGVAVRLRSTGDSHVVLHQRARVGREVVYRAEARPRTYTYSNQPVTYEDVTWRDPCGNPVVHAAATFLGPDGAPQHVAPALSGGVVPVDVAVSDGGQVAVAFAGEPGGDFSFGPQVIRSQVRSATAEGGCLGDEGGRAYPGQAVALAYSDETLVVQLRAPSRLVVGEAVVELGGESARDSGHEVFHLDTGGGIACASCHPGGGDDGHVWEFAAVSPVRTQPLEGMVDLAPYHRRGDVASFEDLMSGLADQMAGPRLDAETLASVRHWLVRLPAAPRGPLLDRERVQRGAAVFVEAGCERCHAGELGTDRSYQVGERTWQTPPLRGIALRAPYLHDGRAATLDEALPESVSALPPEEREDLLAYLRSR